MIVLEETEIKTIIRKWFDIHAQFHCLLFYLVSTCNYYWNQILSVRPHFSSYRYNIPQGRLHFRHQVKVWGVLKPLTLDTKVSHYLCGCCLVTAAAAAKSLQSCPTLCDPIDGSTPGCPVPGILQARTLEWVAISFSTAWKWKVKVKSLSRVRPSATPWTAAFQAPPPMGFSRQE